MKSSAALQQKEESGTYAEWLLNDTIEINFYGTVTEEIALKTLYLLNECLENKKAQMLLADCTAVRNYSANVHKPAQRILELASKKGVRYGVCIAPSSPVRMAASVMAFVSRIPFDFVANREEALRRISRKRLELRLNNS